MNLMVSIISDQTIPNLLLMKEINADQHLFISSKQMEIKGISRWILKSLALPSERVKIIQVDQFSFEDVVIKLDEIDFDAFTSVSVNITGGTKIMSLAVKEYFQRIGAQIYYVTNMGESFLKLSPTRRIISNKIQSSVSVEEYLLAYGFELKKTVGSSIPEQYTNFYYSYSLSHALPMDVIRRLRDYRKKKKIRILEIEGLEDFLCDIDFPCSNSVYLDETEIKYLTGEWLEEYVAFRIIRELDLRPENIMVGVVISRERVDNELDVVFIHNNTLHVVECKTSTRFTDETGKKKSLLGEIIYKSDSLKQKFGLHCVSVVLMLNKLNETDDLHHIKRAALSKIKLIDRNKIMDTPLLSDLITQ